MNAWSLLWRITITKVWISAYLVKIEGKLWNRRRKSKEYWELRSGYLEDLATKTWDWSEEDKAAGSPSLKRGVSKDDDDPKFESLVTLRITFCNPSIATSKKSPIISTSQHQSLQAPDDELGFSKRMGFGFFQRFDSPGSSHI